MKKKEKLYLASGFNRRYHLRKLRLELEEKGYFVVSRWIFYDSRPNRGSQEWESFAVNVAQQNMEDLLDADILIVDTEGIRTTNNGGVHTELGFFLATGKPIYLIGKRGNTFHWLPQVMQVDSYQELITMMSLDSAWKASFE